LLLKAAAEALTVIAADPKYLGANIGLTAVLHSWGENLHHHPHAHCIVAGGGISPDGKRWVPCKRGFLPPRVLSRLFRRLVLEGLIAAFDAGQLHFFTALSGLNERAAFAAALMPLRRTDWVVYAKRTFAGPKRVLAYLARYTHRVAISNDRLLAMNGSHVSFSCKDGGGTKKVMTLKTGEFIRRFLLHVLPDGFHRIRNYGLLANGHRAEKLAAAGACRSLRALRERLRAAFKHFALVRGPPRAHEGPSLRPF
jgi:Putative transposase